jgi:microcystin degradation protein MlrC
LRIFSATLGTESNSFSPLPTGWTTFRETLFHRSGASSVSDNYFVLPAKVWSQLAAARRDTFVESLAAFAQPAGLTMRSVWESLRDMVLDDLRGAGAIDVVLLHLHGAMVAIGYDDCEGDLLVRLREIVGAKTVIGVELDLHCHLTEAMVGAADAIVLYKEYPHIDLPERAAELFEICVKTFEGAVRPVMALHDCRMLGVWRTPDPQVRAIVDDMTAAERRPRLLSVSFCHGFPWSDVPEVGAKMLAITDSDPALAARTAEEFGERIWGMRDTYATPLLDIDRLIDRLHDGTPGVTVVADVSDNAGGGAASDSTYVLRALLDARLNRILLGLLWDPVAARLCAEAGEGETLALRVGGKTGPLSGKPLDLTVTVKKVLDEATISFGQGRQPMGLSVLVSAGGVDLVLNTVRTQAFHPDGFTQFGIALQDYRAVVVKSAQHFYAGFAPHASRVLFVATSGTVSPDFEKLDLKRAGRPLWPKVKDPFVAGLDSER